MTDTRKQRLSAAALRLRRAADEHPVERCALPLHPRHQLVLGDGAVISFTRNVSVRGEGYYLSVRGPRRMPNQHELDVLVSFFFDRDRPVRELMGITTPGVRCVVQELFRRDSAMMSVV